MMKSALLTVGLLLAGVTSNDGQGLFQYDQSSSTNEALPAGLAENIQPNQPMGQSFIPSLSAIGFIRLYLEEAVFNGASAIVFVNLRSGSITGAVVSATSPVFLRGGYFGYVNFLFTAPIAVNPGTTYFLQPIFSSTDTWRTSGLPGTSYGDGTAFFNGIAASNEDLWFREGIVVPEPSAISLLMFVAGFALWFRPRRNDFIASSVRRRHYKHLL
jgi:hypothetical protein